MTRRVDRSALDGDDNGLYFLAGATYTGESVETLKDGSLLSLTTYLNGVEEEQFFDGHGALEWSRRWDAEGDLVEDTSPTARPA